MKIKQTVLIVTIVIISFVGIFLYIRSVEFGGKTQYTQKETIHQTNSQTAQRVSSTEVIDAFIETNEDLNVLDVLHSINNSLTERFLTYYDEKIGLETQGVDIPTREKVLRDFLVQENFENILKNYPLYTTTDLRTVAASENTFAQYKKGFETSVALNLKISELENELSVFRKAQTMTNKQHKEIEIQKLTGIQKNYTALRDSLLLLYVPSDALIIHLDLVNSINFIINRIEGMQTLIADPLRAQIYASSYEKDAHIFIDSYTKLTSYLSK